MSIFRSGRRVRREAAEWVARLGGGAGGRDHAAFRAWYDADRRNAETYDRMAAIWSASGQLSARPSEDLPRRPATGRAWTYALAASLLAVAALAFMLRGGTTASPEPAISYATGPAELREVTLPDGSRVTLDAESRVELAYSNGERRVLLLGGRARFSVAHEQRPFIVRARDEEVLATGTVFDVSLLDDRLSVALLEGTVEVRHGRLAARSITRLTSGNRLVIGGQAAPYSLRVAPGDTAWANRMLDLADVPLGEAVAMANRYSTTQIRIEGEAVRRLRVTGAYRAGDATGLARGLAAAFDLQVSTDPDGHLRLRARPQVR